MARTKQTIQVDREMELTVVVGESGVVTLNLGDDAFSAELRSGDGLVLILRPVQPIANQTRPTARETYNNSGQSLVERVGNRWGAGAGAAAERAVGEGGPDASEDRRSDEHLEH